MATDPGPVILTRAELQRRTRERSKLAALKIAEEHGKARKGGTGMRRVVFCCVYESILFILYVGVTGREG